MHKLLKASLLVLVLAGSSVSGGESNIQLTGEWELGRIWKSAKGKGRYHFYTGKCGLRNKGKAEVQNVRMQITLLDPKGKKINSSKQISYGNLKAGGRAVRKWSVDRAVQFGELVMSVKYDIDGKEFKESFSSDANGGEPAPIVADPATGVMELRTLSHEIEQPILGKKKKKTTLIVRVRNLAAVPAGQPTAKIKFKVEKTKGKRRSSRRKKNSESSGKVEIVEMEVLLDEGAVPPGETRTYSKVLKKAPEFAGYSLSVSVNWPEEKTKVEVVEETTGGEIEGDGGNLVIGAVKVGRLEDGTCLLTVPVNNGGETIVAGKLQLTIVFLDKARKEVKKIKHICKESIEKGKNTDVKIIAEDLPAYSEYQVGVAF